MDKIIYILLFALFMSSCKTGKSADSFAVENSQMISNYKSYGETITEEKVIGEAEMLKKFNSLNTGDTISVKFKSIVKEVCQKKGCWMQVDMGEEQAMVRFKDYAFFMPKDIEGREIIMDGRGFVEEMTVADQRHYAEDAGMTSEEIAAITTPKRTFAFEADGVLVPEFKK